MKEIKKAVLLFVALSLLTGVLYPLAVTVIAQAIFPRKANGSIIYTANGTPIGSATADFPYNALASGGSNLGPTNKDLISQVQERVKSFRQAGIKGPLPTDLVMASGSGLDPHISAEGAILQIPRIARQRHVPEQKIEALLQKNLEDRQFSFLGARRVNVLKLNLALDNL
jgi:K+-transporting ATPase ATPase C chain